MECDRLDPHLDRDDGRGEQLDAQLGAQPVEALALRAQRGDERVSAEVVDLPKPSRWYLKAQRRAAAWPRDQRS